MEGQNWHFKFLLEGTEADTPPVSAVKKTRKKKVRRKNLAETSEDIGSEVSENVEPTPLASQRATPMSIATPEEELEPSRPQFGILKAVQMKLAAQQDDTLSNTLVAGSNYPLSPARGASKLDPIMTSTAVKGKKKKKIRKDGSNIPMMRLDNEVEIAGVQNSAYDNTSELLWSFRTALIYLILQVM